MGAGAGEYLVLSNFRALTLITMVRTEGTHILPGFTVGEVILIGYPK